MTKEASRASLVTSPSTAPRREAPNSGLTTSLSRISRRTCRARSSCCSSRTSPRMCDARRGRAALGLALLGRVRLALVLVGLVVVLGLRGDALADAFFLFLFVPYFSLNAAMLAAVVPRSALQAFSAFVSAADCGSLSFPACGAASAADVARTSESRAAMVSSLFMRSQGRRDRRPFLATRNVRDL